MVQIKRNYKISLLSTLLFIISSFMVINISCVLGNDSMSTKEDAMDVLKLEIKLDRDKYDISESILVQCTIMNLSEDPINLKPILFMDMEIHLKYENGKEVVPFGPKILLKELLRKEDIAVLLPGKSYSYKRAVNGKAYFMPAGIGRYELYAVYQNRMDALEKIKLWTGELKSNIVKFEIVNK